MILSHTGYTEVWQHKEVWTMAARDRAAIRYCIAFLVLSLLQIIPIALGTNPIVAPAVICIAFMLILVNSLIIFRGRMLREAAEKYLHL